jgi:hypothetical protein
MPVHTFANAPGGTMPVKNGDTFTTADHEADHPGPKPTEQPAPRGRKDLTEIPPEPAVPNANPAATQPSGPKPALVVTRSSRPSAVVGQRRLSVPAAQGGVTIIAHKGAVLNLKLEVVMPARGGHLGPADSQVLFGGHAIDVEDDAKAGVGSERTKAATRGVPLVGIRRPRRKNGAP